MKVNVICEQGMRQSICQSCEVYFGNAEICFLEREEDLPDTCGEALIISHDVVCNLKRHDLSSYNALYIFYKGTIHSAQDVDWLLQQRERAVKKEDWGRAKAVNDILIDLDFLQRKTESRAFPDYLQIETTSFCNAKCIMCSHYFSNNKGADYLRNDTLKHMRDAVALSRTISLNGMGEPFISPLVTNQIEQYAHYGNRIVTNTNLSVLSDKLISQINSCFDWLEVSVDGASEETYERIRKNLKFNTVLRNLDRLKNECPNVRKHIATVVMRQNVKEMPQMVELAYWSGAKIITFMTLNANIIIQNAQDEMCRYPKVLEYYSAKALEVGENLGIDVIVPNMHLINRGITFAEIREELDQMEIQPMFKSDEDEQRMLKIASVVDQYLESHDEIQRDTTASSVTCSGICDWILKQSYIDLKGNVAMCCRNQSFHTGNVNEAGSFASVWNSSFYKKLREIFYAGYVPESCLKCGLIESGNLRYLSVDINDDFYRTPAYKQRQQETLAQLLEI